METPDTSSLDALTVPSFCRGGAEDLQTLLTIVPPFGPVLVVLQGAELAVAVKALGAARRDKLKQVLLREVTPGESPPAWRRKGESYSQNTRPCLDLLIAPSSPGCPDPPGSLSTEQTAFNETAAKPVEHCSFSVCC